MKSVAVRNAQNCLVVKSVHWASSRTVMAVLSASVEVGASAIPTLHYNLVSKQLQAIVKVKEYCTEDGRI